MQMTLVRCQSLGNATAAIATVIRRLIPPFKKSWTTIFRIRYTSAGTAHTVQVRMALGVATMSTASLISATSVVLNAQPYAGRIAAVGDVVVFERLLQGRFVYDLNVLTSVSSDGKTLGVAATPAAYPVNTRMWLMSKSTDTIPGYGPQEALLPPVSATTEFPNSAANAFGSLFTAPFEDSPLVLESDNITAAGSFNLVSYGHLVFPDGGR
jgi:hypothetical protein